MTTAAAASSSAKAAVTIVHVIGNAGPPVGVASDIRRGNVPSGAVRG
ncbi:MAG: hypothetical protein ACREEP_20795 [Dongiaceae bacterium]